MSFKKYVEKLTPYAVFAFTKLAFVYTNSQYYPILISTTKVYNEFSEMKMYIL